MAVAITIITLAGIVLMSIGLAALLDKLPPNGAVGIRTGYTRASAENWYATHRAASPLLIFGGVAISMLGLAFVPFAWAGKLSDGLQLGITVAGVVLVLMTAVSAWVYGTARAKAA